MNRKVEIFIDTFGKAIRREAGNSKKLCCYLSGGYDSRCILAVMLNTGLQPITVTSTGGMTGKEDVDIAKKIAKRFNLSHEVLDIPKYDHEIEIQEKIAHRFDKVFNGAFMTEYLNMCSVRNLNLGYMWTCLYKHIPLTYELLRIQNNIVFPMLLQDVKVAFRQVPLRFRRNCILQIHIIKRFQPELLEFPFTKLYIPLNPLFWRK